jgi:hypothetical protein
MIRYIKFFGIVLGSAVILAAGIFPFSGQTGLEGYLFVLACVCGGIAGIGALFVYAAQGSRRTTNELEHERYISEDTLHEMRKDSNSGASLGMDLFFLGLISLGVVVLLLKSLPE